MHACDYVDENGEEISTSLMPEYVQIEEKHACDFVDDNGDEISTSLMPEYVQLSDEEPEQEAPSEEAAAQTEETVEAEETAVAAPTKNSGILSVADSRHAMAEQQAMMELATNEVERKAKKQEEAYALSQSEPDSEGHQLMGLMTAQGSLHRIGMAFKPKPKSAQIEEMAGKLGIDVTPEILKMDDNEAITNALVEIATAAGKSEDEIANALA